MKLNQPYYIEPRQGTAHIDLNGTWDFCWTDSEAAIETCYWQHQTTLPKSVFHSLHEAGVLPDPYVGTNSKLYHWVDEKVWYYRKRFRADATGKQAFLCFDGVAYYCRVWLNGNLLGDHEGMFGGPVCEVSQYLRHDAENELIVEVKACNYGCKDSFDNWNGKGENTQIVPWNIARDDRTSTGDFIVVGIWNNIRLEVLEPLHLSRPYLYTQSIDADHAALHLEVQIADGEVNELHPFYSTVDSDRNYSNRSTFGLSGAVQEKRVRIVTEIIEPDTKKVAYRSEDIEPLLNREKMFKNFDEQQYFSKTIDLHNPRLWYPHGMGEPFLYEVHISLYDGDSLCDEQIFRTGVRTFTSAPTHGRKYGYVWQDFLFSVNGQATFLKGMNWMPIDYLYSIDPEEYRWCLTLVRNAGIQFIRIWNGGGMQEADAFYRLCDELGIMVWQDEFIANTNETGSYPHDVLESQLGYTLYRIRNHASLGVLCGGNEFNADAPGNAATMYVQQRTTHNLAPHALWHPTTPYGGSTHVYNDVEPVWFRHIYQDVPFIAESGIHSMPSFSSLKKLLCEKELAAQMPDLTSEAFQQQFPEMLNHFTEYAPDRVPRMLARASQIADLSNITMEGLCEATQMQAYEYYTLMIQAMRENYPNCGGIMPWVFKRHWCTAGIQLVDGMGQPHAPYYAVQNAYRATQVIWDAPWTVIAPGETLPMDITLLSTDAFSLQDSLVRLTVYRPDMTVAQEWTQYISGQQRHFELGSFTADDGFTDRCFLVNVELLSGGARIAETTYFVKCTSQLADPALYESYRSQPSPNLYFANGPWLKNDVQSAKQAQLKAELVSTDLADGYRFYDVRVTNTSDVAAYPVSVVPNEGIVRYFTSDSFLLIKPGDSRIIRVTTDSADLLPASAITVQAWNAPTVCAK